MVAKSSQLAIKRPLPAAIPEQTQPDPQVMLQLATRIQHIAFIMDGNGRWAKKQGTSVAAGHRAGMTATERVVAIVNGLGIKYITLFAFSTENWTRPKAEVHNIMRLLEDSLTSWRQKITEADYRLQLLGELRKLPKSIVDELLAIQQHSQHNRGMTICLALNYGGRDEIFRAAQRYATFCRDNNIHPADGKITDFTNQLDTRAMPDPDLIVRSSGEQRLSNFLLWQAAYSELVFLPALWPEFDAHHIHKAIAIYNNRTRRFGSR